MVNDNDITPPSALGDIGKYRLLEEVGYGGFAAVYKAFDTDLDRVVALKVMHPYWQSDVHFSERFRREAHTMERLQHPNIVKIYESGVIDGQLYMAMEYIPGPTLHNVLKETPILPLEQAVEILEQLALALDYAHRQGVIHRDIKPANVILSDEGGAVHATLLDFGLVKAMSGTSALTSQGMLIGSPEYMSPEQASPDMRRYVGPAADRYALGVLAYRLLAGRVPFPGNTPATLNAHEHKPVPSPQTFRPDLPDAFVDALLTMLAKGPDARFTTASAFAEHLRAVLEAQSYRLEREERLNALYVRLKDAARSKRWDEVLSVSEQIRAIDMDHQDIRTRVITAQRESEAQHRTKAARRRLWFRIAVIGFLFMFVLGGVLWGASRLRMALPRNPALGVSWTRPADAMEMVYVPSGTFLMGAAGGDSDERPVHAVMLDGFWMDRTEVTWVQYLRCVDAGKCVRLQFVEADTSLPVFGVSWEEARAYCAWAGARLPTESEWEYAYRGAESRLYPWGDTFDAAALNFCDVHCDDSWAVQEADDGYAGPAPVASYPAGVSWCGAFDLAGNVWEWVQDWYDAEAYAEATARSPSGPALGSERVLRGGSWRSAEYNVRGSYRFSAAPDQADATWGFRCVRSDR